jgi:hypothetical protein
MTDRGPASEYEVVWKNGHSERLKAHQVSWPGRMPLQVGTESNTIQFHAEVDGRWQLILSAPEDEISIVRNVTHTEEVL